ncbi:MAG: hypothetical protein B7X91_03455 [Hydrogenophilales bacterium 17-64-11]|nr:MAG: hypothetical protein B7X91_03455 [Hydrogenophilales bacterium 17-64-11]
MIRHVSKVALCAAAVFFLSHTASADAACRNFLGSYTASKHWLASAEKGDPLAQANVGDMYRRGDGVDKDFAKAYDWLKKSVAQGCEQGEFALGNLLADMGSSAARKAMDQGNYILPTEVSDFYQESLRLILAAAEKGLSDAQHSLAIRIQLGLWGVEKDDKKAFWWHQKAAEQGHSLAQWDLGRMLIEGSGVEKSLADGYFWWSIAKMPDEEFAKTEREKVRQQMTDSQIRIAESKLQAWREKEKFETVKARAESDWPAPSPEAKTLLAMMYLDGTGTPRDAALAYAWFLKAAQQGHAPAQYFLGLMHKDGEGVPKNYQLAAEWFRKAANQGDAEAQMYLGLSYSLGLGLTKDEQAAYFWLLLAAAKGDQKVADIRDKLERKLTHEERAKAQAAARDWKPSAANSTPSPTDAPIAFNAKPKATGSGFFVSRNRVVTNFHVIDGCARIAISGKGAARVLSSDARNDLALLESKAGNDSVATLRDGRLRAGEPITVIGYPLAGLLAQGANVTTGNVSALAGPRNDVRLVQITAPVQSGNSGGPLIDASGNVAGVVVSKLDTLKVAKATGEITQNVNFAINGTMLQAFLDSSGTQYRTAPLGRKLSAPDIAERAKQFTGLVECY